MSGGALVLALPPGRKLRDPAPGGRPGECGPLLVSRDRGAGPYLRQSHPVFRRRRLLVGADTPAAVLVHPADTPMTAADWQDPGAQSLTLYLDGTDAPDRAPTAATCWTTTSWC